MGAVSLTGKDVCVINGRVIHDLANGDVVKIKFEADLAKVEAAKDGNVIYGLNEGGKVADLELHLLQGSADDRYLNSLLASQTADFSGFILITGSFVKRVGDGNGKIKNVIYNLIGGMIMRFPDASTSTSGDAQQSVAVWTLKFGSNSRAIM